MLNKEIRKAMGEMGIKKQELSERSGVPMGTLNKILYGETANPSLDTVRAIARALGRTLDDFASDDSGDRSAQKWDDEVEEYLEHLHKRPEMKMLFRASKNVSKEQLEQVVKMIESFAPQEYDE